MLLGKNNQKYGVDHTPIHSPKDNHMELPKDIHRTIYVDRMASASPNNDGMYPPSTYFLMDLSNTFMNFLLEAFVVFVIICLFTY